MIAAVDFETFYDEEVSVGELGIHHYLRAPKSDIYLVAIATDTGLKFSGHPKDFDWSQIAGPDWTWLSHNAQFDMPVFQRIQELGVGNSPDVRELAAWHDTADLAAFLGCPRSLKEAAGHLLKIKLSKDVRDKMKGKRLEELSDEVKQEVLTYAEADAQYCLEIWLKYSSRWPETEREISRMTRSMALKGVPLDLVAIEKDLEKLELDMWEMRQTIPWRDEPHPTSSKAKKGEKMPLLSPIALREECLKVGLTPPTSFAQDDPEAEQFFEINSVKYPWILAVRNYRKAGKHLKTLETMRRRARDDGWMSYGLRYGGAHTLRDSGDSGLNMQNLPKGLVCGVDIRAKIKAPEGYTFAIVDLSQIEPRCLHWLAEDERTLDYIRAIKDLYEAQARAWGLYSGDIPMSKHAPELRFTMKQLALGLGYGMGAKKFSEVAGVTFGEAERLTKMYRSKNPSITALWKKLENPMVSTAMHPTDKDYKVQLPSGRMLTYRRVAKVNGSLTAEIPRSGKFMRLSFWGGVLTENLVQSTARDVFMQQCLEIERQGISVIMRVHDEAVCIVPEEKAQEYLDQIVKIMSTPPDWAPGLPLAAEGSLSKIYKK